MGEAQQSLRYVQPPAGYSPATEFRVLLVDGQAVAQMECRNCQGTGRVEYRAGGFHNETWLQERCRDCAGGVETVTDSDEVEDAVATEIAVLRGAGKNGEADKLEVAFADCQRRERAIAEAAYQARRFSCARCNWRGERAGECVNCGHELSLATELPLVEVA